MLDRAEGEQADVLAAVAAAIDHVLGERKRRISGQLSGRRVTRESQRAVWLGEREIKLEVRRENDAINVRGSIRIGRWPKTAFGLEAWRYRLERNDRWAIRSQCRSALSRTVLR